MTPDRERAAELGVLIQEIASTLNANVHVNVAEGHAQSEAMI